MSTDVCMVSDMETRINILSKRLKNVVIFLSTFWGVLILLMIRNIINGNITANIWSTQTFITLMFLLPAAGVLLGYFYLYRPYKKLEEEEKEFVNSDLKDSCYQASYSLSMSNKKAIERLQKMVDYKKVLELSIKQTRYMALQQQINPHFLYNTLDAIRSDVILAGEIKIADTLEALLKYFSYTISNIEQLATIAEELVNVRDYFCIQKYRFGDRINLKIINEIDEYETKELVIPRLTLQPLVENAIIHGLEEHKKYGTVVVRLARTEDNLVFHVIDDGGGIEQSALNRVNERMNNPIEQQMTGRKKRGGIALYNVNVRIKLIFGETYGLRLFSVLGAGTDVRVLLPGILKESINEERISANIQ